MTSPEFESGEYGEAVDCDLKFTTIGDSTWYTTGSVNTEYYYDGDAVYSGETSDGEEACLQTIVDSDSSETLKFYWKVSCQADYDYLEFYIDDVRQDRISGNVDWQQKSYSISSGIHILKWRYIDGNGSSGDNCGYLDFVQWTGPSPDQDPDDWQEITYKQDVNGRRVEKKVDGYSTRYVHDGDHIIAEYDGNNNLLRKFIYGPGIDQPISMIEEGDDDSPYYYHFDALGSVVALSDSSGNTVQTYEYSVYGEVAATDNDHPNPYMFAGRRYDIEIGLYYNRARYYNPYTGRFLQTDPIGYKDGMNLYRYCMNNPLNMIDPFGLVTGTVPTDSSDKGDCSAEEKAWKDAEAAWNAARSAFDAAGTAYANALTNWIAAGQDEIDAIIQLGKAERKVIEQTGTVSVVGAGAVTVCNYWRQNPGDEAAFFACQLLVIKVYIEVKELQDDLAALDDARRHYNYAVAAQRRAFFELRQAATTLGNARRAYREAEGRAMVAAARLYECYERNRK